MASFNRYADDLLAFEGGFVNDPDDPGGETNKGITLATWRKYGKDKDADGDIDADDLKLINETEAKSIYKKVYWDRARADEISLQPLAEIIVDHGINAGLWRSVMMAQALLKKEFSMELKVDGILGPNTLKAINQVNGYRLHDLFKALRKKYYRYRAGDLPPSSSVIPFFRDALKVTPSSRAKKFLDGWLARVNAFKDLVKKNPLITALALTATGALFVGLVKSSRS